MCTYGPEVRGGLAGKSRGKTKVEHASSKFAIAILGCFGKGSNKRRRGLSMVKYT
jgi:hypothetical protein